MTERARLQVALSMRRQRESSYILQNFNHIGSICIYTYCPTEKQKNDIWDELPAFLQFLLVKQYLICWLLRYQAPGALLWSRTSYRPNSLSLSTPDLVVADYWQLFPIVLIKKKKKIVPKGLVKPLHDPSPCKVFFKSFNHIFTPHAASTDWLNPRSGQLISWGNFWSFLCQQGLPERGRGWLSN